jgi:hypothetical protein
VTVLANLIDKQDTFEIVRDQIAGLLTAETLNQQALATAGGEDPLLWAFDVFLERDWPIERWLNASPNLSLTTAPVVSVWFESSSVDPSTSTLHEYKFEGTYVLDIMARGVTSDDPGGGHIPADQNARLNCHAAVRLVRNILSATENRRLQLPASIVWANPKFQNFEFGPAPLEEISEAPSVWNCRCRFQVKMTEMAPEFTDFGTIELIKITLSDEGQVLLVTDIP